MRKFVFTEEHATGGVSVVTVSLPDITDYLLTTGLTSEGVAEETAVTLFCKLFDAQEVVDPPYTEAEHLAAQLLLRVPGDLLSESMLTAVDQYLVHQDASECSPQLALRAITKLKEEYLRTLKCVDNVNNTLKVVIDDDQRGTGEAQAGSGL